MVIVTFTFSRLEVLLETWTNGFAFLPLCSLIVAISCDPGNAYFTDKDPVTILALHKPTNTSLFSKRCDLSGTEH